tara:strand:+ start:432 stop:551 length:120 start_codon:yes stop_codon:yes gene_type:complete
LGITELLLQEKRETGSEEKEVDDNKSFRQQHDYDDDIDK